MLQRPERLNGFTMGMKRELTEWLIGAQVSDEVRVIVLSGAGGNFSAGDDISAKPDDDLPEPRLTRRLDMTGRSAIRTYEVLRLVSQPLVRTLYTTDKPTIAAVDGYAIQSGLSIALACDFRVATDRVKLSSGTLRFGYAPDDGGHHLLVRALGYSRAAQFVMFNEFVGAEEAHRLGLVTAVTSPDQLEAETARLAAELGRGPQVAMRLIKRGLQSATQLDIDAAFDDMATKTAISDHHPDAAEGGRAFLEKRAPTFNAWLEG